MRLRLQTGVGGTIRLVPSESEVFGPPASGTVTVRPAIGGALPSPVQGAPATLDTFASTLAQAASAGDLSITLASTSGLRVGGTYLAQAADGERFLVEVEGFNPTTNGVLLGEPLSRDLAAGDAVTGVELSFVITPNNAPTPIYNALPGQSPYSMDAAPPVPQNWGNQYLALWSYQIAGVSYGAEQLFEINLANLKPTLSADEVADFLPDDWVSLVRGGPRRIRKVVAIAWNDLLDDLAARGYASDRIRDPDGLKRPHRSKTIANLAASWGATWMDWAKAREVEYHSHLEAAMNNGAWYDARPDLIQGTDEVKWPSVVLSR